MVDADPRLESCAKPVYYPVREPDAAAVMKFRLHKIRDTLPSDILALRVKYSLSQAQAAKIFGGGANAFSKWERGEVIPTESTAKLLRLAYESDAAMELLANHAGVKLDQDAGREQLSNDEQLKGWLWNIGRVTAAKNPAHFVSFTEINRDCVINEDWYPDESQSAAA